MTELLVGTKKGLFRLEGDGGPAGFEITARAFAGQSVEYAMRDARTGRYLASVTSWFYGPRIWVTDDPTGEWEQAARRFWRAPGRQNDPGFGLGLSIAQVLMAGAGGSLELRPGGGPAAAQGLEARLVLPAPAG